MGGTTKKGPVGLDPAELVCAAETPGTLGLGDRADPDEFACFGDSPGPAGVNDLSAALAGWYDPLEAVCWMEDPGGPATTSGSGPATVPGKSAGGEIYVVDKRAFVDAAKLTTGLGLPAAVLDAGTVSKLVSDLGWSGGKFYLKSYGGREYIIFRGYAGLREFFTGTRYLADNTRVLTMAVGKKGLARSAVRSGVITIVLVAAVDVVEYVIKDEATLADLGVNLFSDVSKAAVSTAAGFAASKLVLAAFAGTAAAPLAVGVVVAIAVGVGLEAIDRHFGLSDKLKQLINDEFDRMAAEIRRELRPYDPTTLQGIRNWMRGLSGIPY